MSVKHASSNLISRVGAIFSMSRIAAVNLQVACRDAKKTVDFYRACGMSSKEDGLLVFANSSESAGIALLQNKATVNRYTSDRGDVYWKIGFAVDDVDATVVEINKLGLISGVGDGHQFIDVGYLTHLQDPSGFTVELLQTTFETSEVEKLRRLRIARDMGPITPHGQAPVIGQITLRVSNISASLDFYRNMLQMKLLCIEPVARYGFTLYFLAYTTEDAPNMASLEAVENREWLYQRPFTTLELQHPHDAAGPMGGTCLELDTAGFHSFTIQASDDLKASLKGQLIPIGEHIGLRDPDGTRVIIQ